MSSVHFSITLPAAVRLVETECRHFLMFTVLGFLPSTTDASVVPRHHGLGFFGVFLFLF